ncbi:TlpA family protein disulfide reductase [Mucilaginibacter agri]|uniref:Redoxin domain-containing protein n=1 Tax=Mucilaginibacter agri TaxID=2695265 RepID=A0A965ZDG7_9SPHI|nr:redoxin domain-containing protein [Mucilaginibacter agri]NCD68730.1 redoxin domain-containing protein [Mucilaginibacter agri]
MKKLLLIAWLVILATTVVVLFWYNQYRYSLPTPVPEGYVSVKRGTTIHLVKQLNFHNNKPVFLHFFNPDCPCSRFNMAHFKSLVNQYGNKVNFVMVLMTNKPYAAAEIQQRFDINIPVLPRGHIAEMCGVYSTPQAVIINAKQQLYYRGNYNRSRYCEDKKTEYARMALQDMLQQQPLKNIDLLAWQAYGCQLPDCTR